MARPYNSWVADVYKISNPTGYGFANGSTMTCGLCGDRVYYELEPEPGIGLSRFHIRDNTPICQAR